MGIFSFGNKKPDNVKSLNAADFKQVIGDKKVQLVDVRTAGEYKQGTIGKALNLDVFSPGFATNAEAKLDKGRPVAVFCHSGARSISAAKMLEKKGFPEIYNLKGGIMSWR